MGRKKLCVQPNAPWTECVICGSSVKTCEREEPVFKNGGGGWDYTCPAHPDGVEISLGWVCSEACYNSVLEMQEGK
jgi:hypothetical protein